ncbi:MAG TPA: hypothetical protein VFA43_01760 [Gemmatimonadaceae bacterium]|nr:hypothetical protein [Gemmatimonadaceae bacterium]
MRGVVGFAVGVLAVCSLACSNTSNPVADSRIERDVSVPPGAVPYATGIHAAALPAFDDPALVVTAFNNIGEIVGDSNNPVTFGSTVFRWTAQRGFTFLHLPVDSFSMANAFSVNDGALVAIQLMKDVAVQDQIVSAAIWNWQGDVKFLRPLGTGFNCFPESINNSNVMVGTCYVPGDTDPMGSPSFPTIWSPSGTPVGLMAGGQPIQGTATTISDAGYIAGQTSNAGYVFTPTKQLIALPPPNASIPNQNNTGVNDSGWVAGSVFDSVALHDIPAVWIGHNDSLVDVYGRGRGSMTAISDDGIAVGSVEDTVTGLQIPVIWTQANGLQRLPGLERSNLLAQETGAAGAINQVHQILGTIVMSTGQRRVVMWSLPDTPTLQAQIYFRHAAADRPK